MRRILDRYDGGLSWHQWDVEPVGHRFFIGVLNTLAIEAGVGAFIWLAIHFA